MQVYPDLKQAILLNLDFDLLLNLYIEGVWYGMHVAMDNFHSLLGQEFVIGYHHVIHHDQSAWDLSVVAMTSIIT